MKKIFPKYIVVSFFCLYTLPYVFSQPRVDGGIKVQVLKSSPVVTNFVGWYYNQEHQKWCGSYNVIGAGKYNNNKVPRRLVPDDLAVYEKKHHKFASKKSQV